MSIEELAFGVFALLVTGSALAILFTRNVVHAAFYLVVCMVSVAGLYILLNAMFLAVVQLLIYAGGVLILLAFGIMLTNRPDSTGKLTSGHRLQVIGVLVVGGLFVLLTTITLRFVGTEVTVLESYGQVERIGQGFMTDYLLAFELIAYLLLVVLVGAGYYAKKSQEV